MIEKPHFSLVDWDYWVPGPYISDEVFVSAPSSLAARKEAPFDRQGWAMCNLLSAQNVFDGRIVNYIRNAFANSTHVQWYYRAQVNPTTVTGSPYNCYRLIITTYKAILTRIASGVPTTLASYNFDPYLATETFYQFRVTWWQYLQPDMTKLLRHTIEQYKAGAWVELFHYDDSTNSWATSATNKVGFTLLHQSSSKITAIDNTEIWKRLT